MLLLLLKELGRIDATRIHDVHVHAYVHSPTACAHELGGTDGTTAKGVWGELGMLLLLVLVLLGTNRTILKASSEHGWVNARWVGI